MGWCEANGVDFVFGQPRNARLAELAATGHPRSTRPDPTCVGRNRQLSAGIEQRAGGADRDLSNWVA